MFTPASITSYIRTQSKLNSKQSHHSMDQIKTKAPEWSFGQQKEDLKLLIFRETAPKKLEHSNRLGKKTPVKLRMGNRGAFSIERLRFDKTFKKSPYKDKSSPYFLSVKTPSVQ